MKLISAEDVRIRMGIDPALAAGVDPVLDSLIMSAQLRMEVALDSEFDTVVRRSVFLLDPSVIGVVPDGYHRLYLESGFVRSDATITVSYGPVTSLVAIDPAWYIVKSEKGVVLLPEAYSNQTITVDYTTGFDENDEPPPEWLREVMISAVSPLANSLQPTNNSSAAKAFYDTINRHIDDIMSKHRRNPGLVYKAM
jgi:hypothetical protein